MTPADRTKRLVVTISEIFCLIGTLVGTGVIGTRVQESSGGALAADATLLAPAGPAFSIWSVIYTGLLAYTIYLWLPGKAKLPIVRKTAYPVAASMVLNATWLLVTQAGWIWVSVLVIFALLISLLVAVFQLEREREHMPSAARTIIFDGTLGLYLGWVTVASCANVTAALVASGVNAPIGLRDIIALAVLVVAGFAVNFITKTLGARLAVVAAVVWGLSWIAIGRLGYSPLSPLTAGAAIAVAGWVILTLWKARRR